MTQKSWLCCLAFFVNSFGSTFTAQLGVKECHDPVNCDLSPINFQCHDELPNDKCVNVGRRNLTILSSSMWIRNVSQIYAYRNKVSVFDIYDPEILTHIDISHNKLNLLPVHILSKANNLIYLNVAHNNLQNISSAHIRKNDLLKILDLSYNSLTRLSEEIFSNLKELERLFLNGNRLSSLPKRIFEHCTNLASLNLASNVIETLIEGTFNNLDNIWRLDLSNNRLKQLPYLGHMPKLHVMDVSENNIVFIEVQQLPRLLLFILENNNLEDVDVSMFPTSVHQMRKVDLRYNRFSSVNVTLLQEFNDTKVNSLLLDGNPWVCDAAICPLVQAFPRAGVWFRSDPRCSGPNEMAGKFLYDEEVIRRVCSAPADQLIGIDSNVDVTADDKNSLRSTTKVISSDLSDNNNADSSTEASESGSSLYTSTTEESTHLYLYTVRASTTEDDHDSGEFNTNAKSSTEASESDSSPYSSTTEESSYLYPHTVITSTTESDYDYGEIAN